MHRSGSAVCQLRSSIRAVFGIGLWAWWWLGWTVVSAQAGQDTVPAGGIYVCVDRSGRRITADRPIPECLDREQRELTSTGITRRVVPPNLTAEERAIEEAKAKQEAVQRVRLAEEKRRDLALLSRYSNARQHEQERQQQLAIVKNTQAAIQKRSQELIKQRDDLQVEMEFYKADPKKAPAWLQHRINYNAEQIEAQKRLLDNQSEEGQRINARFDEELVRLKQIWAAHNAAR